MPVYYNVIQRPEPGVAGGGEMKWYASTTTNGETDIDQLIKKVEKISTMSGGDVQGVTYTLVDVIIDELAQGRIVRLGQLGDMYIAISSTGHESEEEVGPHSIRRSKINYRPGKPIKEMLKTLDYKKITKADTG